MDEDNKVKDAYDREMMHMNMLNKMRDQRDEWHDMYFELAARYCTKNL